MKLIVPFFFAASVSASPFYYFPYVYGPPMTRVWCTLPPCPPEAVIVEDPFQQWQDYECPAVGKFPAVESNCEKYFECVQQGDNLRVRI